MAAQPGHAATTGGGYKALVCVFLHGGSDMHNWIVPVDTDGYAEYARARGDLAWPKAKLRPLSSTSQAEGRAFAMPQEIAPLAKWYEAGKAAVIANVGPLSRPISKSEYSAGIGVPKKLFSHNDQASTWQSLAPEGASSGWGGRMADLLATANGYPVFTATSAAGNTVFLTGHSVTQFQVAPEGAAIINGLAATNIFGSNRAPGALQKALASSGPDLIQREYSRILQRSISANSVLQLAMNSAAAPEIPATAVLNGTAETTLNQTNLAMQLRTVAQMIAANQRLGMRRQVFFVSMGGFDTHADQMRIQPGQMQQVAHSIDYFLSAMESLGMLDAVTLFTASDFGRTLLSNGDGSDHGWGSHHFVAGGGVKGRRIYGDFPIPALGTSTDIGSGRLLPTTAVSQMAASMGSWLGLSSAELKFVLPDLAQFGPPPNFMI
ncbi:DUF1501 domain-containing protein [Aquincola agrisoli]